MSTMSMRQTDGIAPHGQISHVWVTRMQPGTTGSTQIAFLSRWPATLVHVPREESVKMGYLVEVMHTLAGPAWKGKLIAAGDLIQHVVAADGIDYVKPGKPWIVQGRIHDHGIGDLNGQIILVKEEV